MSTQTEDRGPDSAVDESAYAQAAAQYKSIVEMVNALNCDYDRLKELREECDDLKTAVEETTDEFKGTAVDTAELRRAMDEAENNLRDWPGREEYTELLEQAGECEDADEARQRIEEDALSVEVRSDWHAPCDTEGVEPAEFRIVLCTGGPHVEIRGELRNGEPCRALLHYKDWDTSGDYFGDGSPEFPRVDQDVLLAYASVFYYGE